MTFKILPSTVALVTLFTFTGIVWAGDLDDGISKYTDESISKDDDLGKPDKNIKFIIMKAKSKADMAEKKGNDAVTSSTSSSSSSVGSMNSVIAGPGSTFKGDIIILDESRGDKTQVVE